MGQFIPLGLRYMTVNKPFVITIVGAESSGKTMLAMKLAEHFKCPWVPEYAREYLALLGRPYEEEDLAIIAGRQLEIILAVVSRESSVVSRESSVVSRESSVVSGESSVVRDSSAPNPLRDSSAPNPLKDSSAPNPLKGAKIVTIISDIESNASTYLRNLDTLSTRIVNPKSSIVIVDGGMMNLRMWARIKYKKTIPVVEEALKDDMTDLYVLCRPRKGWTPDPLREAPGLLDRVWIYNQYLEELVKEGSLMELVRAG